jgi:hypothetical protein
VVLLAAVALGYLAVPAPDSHWQIFQIGDYRGEYTSVYVGTVTALAGGGIDVLGLKLVTDSMHADIVRAFGDTKTAEFGVGLVERKTPLAPFAWSGAAFWGTFAVQRLIVLAVAVALALLGSAWFHRFDPARGRPRRRAEGAAKLGAAG